MSNGKAGFLALACLTGAWSCLAIVGCHIADRAAEEGRKTGPLEHRYPYMWLQAIEELEKSKDARAVDTLVGALSGPTWAVRQRAAEALRKLGDARAVEPLIRCVKEGNADLRKTAIEALIRLGKPAVEPLITCLKDDDPVVHERAAEALGKLGDKAAIGALVGCLKAPASPTDPRSEFRSNLRAAAIEALGNLGDPKAVEAIAGSLTQYESEEVASSVAQAHAKLGEPGFQALLRCLAHDHPRATEAAAKALGDLGDGRAMKPLIAYLRHYYYYWYDYHDTGRNAAVEALTRFGKAAFEPLLWSVTHGEPEVRPGAAAALGHLGDARAFEPLIGVLRDKEARMRAAAAEGLGTLGDARAVEPLIVLLKDEDRDVRQDAAKALGKVGDARAFGPLVACLTDAHPKVRGSAADALVKLNWMPPDEGQRAAYLIARECWNAVRRVGKPAVDPLISSLRTDWSQLGQQAAEALGDIGEARAAPFLIACFERADWTVSAAAIRALAKLGDARAVEPLIARLKDTDNCVRTGAAAALGKLGDRRAVGPLIGALKDELAWMRWAAAEALGMLGDARAIEPLTACLRDGETTVRERAADAIAKLRGKPRDR